MLEVVGAVRSLRKGKGKVFSTQKELNNPFKISVYMDRQPLMPTFLTLALYVDWFFFFFSFSIPSPDGFLLLQISRGCQIFQSAPGWNKQSFLATLFYPPPHSRVLSLPQKTRPPALHPLHVILKEQNKEEKKKRRASNREPEPRKKSWRGPKGRKGKGWTATKRSDCGNFPAPLARRREFLGRAWFQHRGDWTAPRGDFWATCSHSKNSISRLSYRSRRKPCFISERQGQSDAQPCTGSAPVLRCKPSACFSNMHLLLITSIVPFLISEDH